MPGSGLQVGHAAALAALTESLEDLLQTAATFDGADWQAATRCRGWTVADVHAHLDLARELDLPAAPAASLVPARRTVLALAGVDPGPLAHLDDETVVLVGAGRLDPGPVVVPPALAAVLG